MDAADICRAEVVKVLVAAGADVHAQDEVCDFCAKYLVLMHLSSQWLRFPTRGTSGSI